MVFSKTGELQIISLIIQYLTLLQIQDEHTLFLTSFFYADSELILGTRKLIFSGSNTEIDLTFDLIFILADTVRHNPKEVCNSLMKYLCTWILLDLYASNFTDKYLGNLYQKNKWKYLTMRTHLRYKYFFYFSNILLRSSKKTIKMIKNRAKTGILTI